MNLIKNRFKNGWWLCLSFLLLVPETIFAQISTGGATGIGGGKIENPLGSTGDLYAFIAKLLDAVAKLGAVVVVFFIIYSGFLFVTAQGSEEKLSTAKKALLYTLIGAAILLGAKAISLVIQNTITQLQQ